MSLMLRLLSWLMRALLVALMTAWSAGALYYSVLPWLWLRLLLAALIVSLAIWVLTPQMRRKKWLIYAAAWAASLCIWAYAQPSHERQWTPDVARSPKVEIEGDVVRLHEVRDFEYRSLTDFTPRWISREVRLSSLIGADFFISYWTPEPGMMAHTFLSFTFADAPPLSISVEARREVGEPFSTLGGLFRQFELIYVVGEERDIAGCRTHFRNEKVYLFPLRMQASTAQKLFLSYVASIQQLIDQPRYYHLLEENCTTSIQRHAPDLRLRHAMAWQVLLNGHADEFLHSKGALDTELPFATLKPLSQINDAARSGGLDTGFSARIRAVLPPRASVPHQAAHSP
jgi:hypothetical protein